MSVFQLTTEKMALKLSADHSQLCCNVTYMLLKICAVQTRPVKTTEPMGIMGYNSSKHQWWYTEKKRKELQLVNNFRNYILEYAIKTKLPGVPIVAQQVKNLT